MYVCTEKAAIQEWLKEIEELKAENKRFEELLTKGKDKRIEMLIKENRELRKENKELKKEKGEVRQMFIKLQEAQAKLIRVAENKELKEEVKKRKMIADENGEHYDMMKDEYEKLEKENKELKKKKRDIKQKLIKLEEAQAKLIRVAENKELKEYWSIEIKTCNRYREKCTELEEENKLLEYAIKELMAQCDIKYFRFRDKEFYKQEFILNLNSKKK